MIYWEEQRRKFFNSLFFCPVTQIASPLWGNFMNENYHQVLLNHCSRRVLHWGGWVNWLSGITVRSISLREYFILSWAATKCFTDFFCPGLKGRHKAGKEVTDLHSFKDNNYFFWIPKRKGWINSKVTNKTGQQYQLSSVKGAFYLGLVH